MLNSPWVDLAHVLNFPNRSDTDVRSDFATLFSGSYPRRMKIARFERVLYAHNPLAEVVCQLRFGPVGLLDSNEPESFQAELSGSLYPTRTTEQPIGITFQFADSGQVAPMPPPPPRLYHYSSQDDSWRITVCSQFVALTCKRYESWDEFLPRMQDIVAIVAKCYPEASPTRLGLRYKDVIERDPLELDGVPWSQLVQPFLLGPFAPGALSEEGHSDDNGIANLLLQSIIKLDDCMLLLQSSLLWTPDRQRNAFLIDADFFTEHDDCERMLEETDTFRNTLDKLHNNAGALFRRCITEKLHHALGPRTQ
jgi:uncharacterized protein (TIGR04255 family)